MYFKCHFHVSYKNWWFYGVFPFKKFCKNASGISVYIIIYALSCSEEYQADIFVFFCPVNFFASNNPVKRCMYAFLTYDSWLIIKSRFKTDEWNYK